MASVNVTSTPVTQQSPLVKQKKLIKENLKNASMEKKRTEQVFWKGEIMERTSTRNIVTQ